MKANNTQGSTCLSPTGSRAAFRQVIRDLVRSLRAVPADVRAEWLDELEEHDVTADSLASSDEFIIKMVLINLKFAEAVTTRAASITTRAEAATPPPRKLRIVRALPPAPTVRGFAAFQDVTRGGDN